MRNIGIKVKKSEAVCSDPRCPFHGNLKCRGNTFTGVVSSAKMQKTVCVEWSWQKYIPKYERYELKKTKVKAHNPACINAKEGEIVKIIGCRPLSKTKNFVIIEKLGTDAEYIIKKERLKDELKENATSKGENN